MANSTTNLDGIVQGQGSQDVVANSMFDALSPASLYGRRASTTSGLNWGYYGGNILLNGVLTQIANGSLALTPSSTNYLEANPADGAVSKNTTGFTAGRWPLYSIVAGASAITSYTDYRMATPKMTGRLALAMSDANTTLTQAQAANDILEFTGTLTAARNIVIPLVDRQYTVANKTTGGFGLQFIGASGTGITVAAGKRAIVYADSTNVVRVTADV